MDLNKETFKDGKYISTELDILIDRIYISPSAKEWFSDLVKSVVKKYNLNVGVHQSKLAEDPVY